MKGKAVFPFISLLDIGFAFDIIYFMRRAFFLFFILIATFLLSCATGSRLFTEPAMVNENERYDLILYGGRHLNDIETIAILDKAGDAYTIEPLAPGFDYYIHRNYPGLNAINSARRWVSFNPAFAGIKTQRIKDRDGSIIGYEVRPLYQPFVFGTMDVLSTSYSLREDGVVKAWIRLLPSVERELLRPDAPGK